MQAGVPYRCWLRLRPAVGLKKPGLLYVQFTHAVDRNGREVYAVGTADYLTFRGSDREKWAWVGRDLADSKSQEPVLIFRTTGEVTVRVTAGESGAAFDQFILSPVRYFEKPPTEAVVPKSRK